MNYYMLGLSAGIIVAGLFYIIYYLAKRKKGALGDYDERQLLARHKAYQIGYFTLMLLLVANAAASLFGVEWAEGPVDYLMCTLLSIGVFVTIVILKDAFAALNENQSKQVFAYIVLGLVNIYNVRVNEMALVENGKLTSDALGLAACLLFFWVAALTFIQKLRNNKAMQEDEE